MAELVDGLKAPAKGPPDSVTKLWPKHMSQAVQQKQQSLPIGRTEDLKARFPKYFELYNYQ